MSNNKHYISPYSYRSEAALYGVKDPRFCVMPDSEGSGDGSSMVPKVDHDSRNSELLPCNRIVPELGQGRLDLAVSVVSRAGCRSQREAGECPRGFGLTSKERAT